MTQTKVFKEISHFILEGSMNKWLKENSRVRVIALSVAVYDKYYHEFLVYEE